MTLPYDPLVMDCDPGWDDALALLLLLARRNGPEMAGVTTVFGNEPLEQTTANAQRMTGFCGTSAVTVRGCDRPLKQGTPHSAARPSAPLEALPVTGPLDTQTTAARFLETIALERGFKVTILATAPLTNIAVAIKNDPIAMRNIGELVIVGGALSDKPTDEFNLTADPEATRITLEGALNTVLIPFETCQQMTNTDVLKMLPKKARRFADFYVDVVNNQINPPNNNLEAGTGIYDAMGALYVLNPGLFTLQRMNVGIDYKIGQIYRDPSGPLVAIATLADVKGAYNLLANALLTG